ncbi:MAG: hypothetical protein AB7F31_05965 [Parachlamydiales bacterium]
MRYLTTICRAPWTIGHNQGFNDVEREDYLSALIAWYERHEARPMVDLYTFSYIRSCESYDTSVE